VTFQLVDGARDGWGRDVELACCPGEAIGIHHGHEDPDQMELIHIIPLIVIVC